MRPRSVSRKELLEEVRSHPDGMWLTDLAETLGFSVKWASKLVRELGEDEVTIAHTYDPGRPTWITPVGAKCRKCRGLGQVPSVEMEPMVCPRCEGSGRE